MSKRIVRNIARHFSHLNELLLCSCLREGAQQLKTSDGICLRGDEALSNSASVPDLHCPWPRPTSRPPRILTSTRGLGGHSPYCAATHPTPVTSPHCMSNKCCRYRALLVPRGGLMILPDSIEGNSRGSRLSVSGIKTCEWTVTHGPTVPDHGKVLGTKLLSLLLPM